MRVIVVGAGILGAAISRMFRQSGADVLVVEQSTPAAGATGASFGWINASFYLNDAHFRLRHEGIAAWHRIGFGDHVAWQGSICWDMPDLAAQLAELEGFGYPVELLSQKDITRLEPHIRAPEAALRFCSEGIAAPHQTTHALLRGVRVVSGARLEAFQTGAHGVSGIVTSLGTFDADHVVLAAGASSSTLLATLGIELPLLDRPGLMLRTPALPNVLSHVIASPQQELRQDAAGHIWAPMSIQHQSDDRERIEDRPDNLADAALERIATLLPDVDLVWDRAMFAMRPMPRDGLPVFGPAGIDGLSIAVMHSGVTLAAIVAELTVKSVLSQSPTNHEATLMAPYAIDRFRSKSKNRRVSMKRGSGW